MYRLAKWVVITLLVFILPSVTRADRDIVFSAQWYRWSGYYHDRDGSPPQRTLADNGPFHLYRINPDGSHRTQITSGKRDDLMPRWSPNGKQVLFARDLPNQRHAICVVGADGGKVRRLLTVRGEFPHSGDYAWSPDGRRIAVFEPDYFSDVPYVVVIDARSGKQHKHSYGRRFAWSPDGKRLFLTFVSGDDVSRTEIWDYSGSKPICQRKLKNGVWSPFWLDNHTILGRAPVANSNSSEEFIRIISLDGVEQNRIQLKLVNAPKENPESGGFYYDFRRWLRIPDSSTTLLLETSNGMSDGEHYSTHQVNTLDGRHSLVGAGMLLGVSGDGTRCAVADQAWVGPYKRGGRRCGPLRIVDLSMGKERAITPMLGAIAGGDWRVNTHYSNSLK